MAVAIKLIGQMDGITTEVLLRLAQKSARELLRRGYLNGGGVAGPSYVTGNIGLTDTWWSILATLSPNAVRGEWQAAA